MSDIWAPVIAALGASLLTTLGLLGRDKVAERRRQASDRLSAYETLLARSMAVVQAAMALRLMMMLRSGMQEGVDIALGHRKPIEPFDLADRITSVFQPLFDAQVTVWACGSPESITLANDIVERCLDLLGLSTAGGQKGGKLQRYVFGERWTPEQEAAYEAASVAVGDGRRRLAELLRREGKTKAAEVFAVPFGDSEG
jgi:hypothetical protein